MTKVGMETKLNTPADMLWKTILSGPLPVADYVAEIHVKDNGDGTSPRVVE